MDTWILIWQVVLVAGLALFAGMSVWITIEGWTDVRKLLEAMAPRPVSGRKGRRAARRRRGR